MHELTLLTRHKESQGNDYFNRRLHLRCDVKFVKCAGFGCKKISVEFEKL